MKSDERRPKKNRGPRKKGSEPAEQSVEQAVEVIRNVSTKRPVRVVIDEVYPGDFYRVLTAELTSKKKKIDETDPTVWGDEVEHHMDRPQLMRLLAGTGTKEVWEGKVFRLKAKRSKDIHEDVRKRVARDARDLLIREGRTYDKRKRRW